MAVAECDVGLRKSRHRTQYREAIGKARAVAHPLRITLCVEAGKDLAPDAQQGPRPDSGRYEREVDGTPPIPGLNRLRPLGAHLEAQHLLAQQTTAAPHE